MHFELYIRYWSFYFASYLFRSWIRFLFYFILLDSTPSLKQFHFLQLENVLNVYASSIRFSYVCVITRFAFCINEFEMMMLL